MQKTDPAFEKLVSGALSEPMRPEQRAALDHRLAVPLGAPSTSRRARTKRPGRLLLLVALLTLGLPFAVASVDDLSELLTRIVSGRDFQVELDAAMAEVPLPDGRDWPDVAALDAENFRGPYEGEPPPGGDYYETGPGAARSVVESVATCVWFDEWLVAHDAGDGPRQAATAEAISKIPTWESWNSRWWDKSYTDLLQQVIDGIAGGDPGACAPLLSPELCARGSALIEVSVAVPADHPSAAISRSYASLKGYLHAACSRHDR